MSFSRLLRITAAQLFGHPLFLPTAWESFSRRAYVEPIVVRDGHHDYVLMAAPDYAALAEVAGFFDGLTDSERAELHTLRARMSARRMERSIAAFHQQVAELKQALAEESQNPEPEPEPAFGSLSNFHEILPALAEMAKFRREPSES